MRLALVVAVLAMSACASGSTASATPINEIRGGSSCPAVEAQDLTFSGALTGHVKCSTTAATCTKAYGIRQGSGGIAFPLNARVGSTAVQLLLVFSSESTGDFPAGPLGDNEKSSTPQGATLDGIGHWGDPAPPDG